LPELPEVETMRRGILSIVGSRVEDVRRAKCAKRPISVTPGLAAFRRRVAGRRVTAVDRVDRADPSRADLAPLRVRINLFAIATGAKLEADLWPHLRGVTFGVLAEPRPSGMPVSALLCLHLDTEDAALRVLDQLMPRLVGRLGTSAAKKPTGVDPSERPQDRGAVRAFGSFSGRPLEAIVRGSTVLVGWGKGALDAALSSADLPTESVRPCIFPEPEKGEHQGPRPDRVGLLWPGRLVLPMKGLDGVSPLSRSLADGPPVSWVGWTAGKHAHDRVRWGELDAAIRRFLRSIPLDPPVKLGACVIGVGHCG